MVKLTVGKVALIVVGLWLLSGCSPAGQMGLANGPNPNSIWGPEQMGRDSIANGPESCARSTLAQDDPLRLRWPRCPETRGNVFGNPAAQSVANR